MDRRKFLTTAGASLAASTLDAVAGEQTEALKQSHLPMRTDKPECPNIIVIICDDLGYGDLGCYGSKLATPKIDRLASQGVRFRHHCTPISLCSASRAALMTGLYPTRVGATAAFGPLSDTGMSLDAITVANVLQKAGYRSLAVGKWHLGDLPQYAPTQRGFDEYFGVPYSVDMDPLPLLHNSTILEKEANRDTLTQQYTKKAVEFISQPKEKPFFLYMAHSYPHIPLHASTSFRGKSDFGLYGDVVAEIDWSVGEVMRALEQTGQREKTLVLFTSDHGPWFQGSTGNLRGRKGGVYEGGLRIPMIASMPGTLPQGHVTDALASHTDILPTVAGLCHGQLPGYPLDGRDIWTLLSCQQEAVERQALLSFEGWDIQCARWKQWKLHIARANTPMFMPTPSQGRINYALRNPELYNVVDDPKESYDCAAKFPEVVATIQKSIQEQLATLPDVVKQAYSAAQQHLSTLTMPADSLPEFRNSEGNHGAWLEGANAEKVLDRFK
ncbi:MAG TPA: sulfatase [Acidobacteriaceae bacterium]|nr:sulfatase [Acidobacteriaceae bacterium]